MKTTPYFGVDVGTSAIKVVRLEIQDGSIHITRAVKLPLGLEPNAQSPGAIEQDLRKKLAEAGLAPLKAPIAIAGPDVMLRYQYLMPSRSLDDVDRMQLGVNDIDQPVEGGLAYNYDVLEMPPELSLNEADRGDRIMLTAMAKNNYLDHLEQQFRASGIRVQRVIPLTVGLFHLLAATGQVADQDIAILLDIGAEYSSIVVTQGNRPFFLRSMPFGGQAITRAIARRLRISQPEAEKEKRHRAQILTHQPNVALNEWESALDESCSLQVEQLCSIVASSLRFAERQLKCKKIEPVQVFLSGGSSLLGGIMPFMQERMGVPVTPLDLHACLNTDRLSPDEKLLWRQNMPQFAAAVGTALSEQERRLSLDLKSHTQRERQRFRSRHLFVYAGVLLFLAGICLRMVMLLESRGQLIAIRNNRIHETDVVREELERITAAQALRREILTAKNLIEADAGRLAFLLHLLTQMAGPPGDTNPMSLPASAGLSQLTLVAPDDRHANDDPWYGPQYGFDLTLVLQREDDDAIKAYLDQIPYRTVQQGWVGPNEYKLRLFDAPRSQRND